MPLGLKFLQAGDISVRPSLLVDGSVRGRGLFATNASQKQLIDFDIITVEGFAEPGWEVELYRNEELIGFQTVDGDGEYVFENVSLNFNRTVLRTVLYGPQGQIEESEKVYNISQDMAQPGKTFFEAGILDQDQNLIPVGDDVDVTRPEGLAHNYKISRGITNWLSAFSTITETPTLAGTKHYSTFGLNLSLLGVLNKVEFYKDEDEGKAIDFRTAGNFAGVDLRLRTAFLSKFESQQVGFGDFAETLNLEAAASRSFRLPFGHLGLRAEIDHDGFEDALSETDIETSQTLSVSKVRLTHTTNSFFQDKEHQNSTGDVSATYNITPSWILRSLLNYDLYPDHELQNAVGEVRYQDQKGFTATLNLDRDLRDGGLSVGGQVGYEFDRVRASVDFNRDEDGEYRAGLRTSFSLAPYGEDNRYIASGDNLSDRSMLKGRVYLDKDADGQYGEGDEPLKGVKLDVGQGQSSPSNEKGEIAYLGPAPDDYRDITLSAEELDNPFYAPATEGYETLVRSGLLPLVDFPVIEVGTIDGVVSSAEGSLAGVSMQLLSEKGEVVDTVSTSFDGFYVFETVKQGEYSVRINPSYDQVSIPPKYVSMSSEDLFPYGIDFQISEQAEEEACTTQEADEDGGITQLCHDRALDGASGIDQPVHFFDPGKAIAVVNHVRIGEHSGKIRLTLDLSAPASFSIVESDDGTRAIVELPDVAWEADKSLVLQSDDIVKNVVVEPLAAGGTQIVLNAAQTLLVIDSAALPPEGEKGHRIYVDVVK